MMTKTDMVFHGSSDSAQDAPLPENLGSSLGSSTHSSSLYYTRGGSSEGASSREGAGSREGASSCIPATHRADWLVLLIPRVSLAHIWLLRVGMWDVNQ